MVTLRGFPSSPLQSLYSWLNTQTFDGVEDYVDIGKLDIIGNQLTILGWFNTSNSTNDHRIISKATSPAEQDHYYMVSTANNTLRFRLRTNGHTTTLVAPQGTINNNTWYHFATTYDGSEMRIYLNGNIIGTVSKTGDISTNNNISTWIGGNPPNPTDRPWFGSLANIEIYDKVLTQEEINSIKNTTTP